MLPPTSSKTRLLLVDDDIELCRLLREYLDPEGFEVTMAHTGPDGLGKALSDEFATVILDVMLPDLGGLDVLRRIREVSRVPILMLSARGEDSDRIVGLEIGADDYLPKPCNARELLARIRALLRRQLPAAAEAQNLRLGDLDLRLGARMTFRAAVPLELTSAEFDLLACLMKRPGEVVSRGELSRRGLGREWSPPDRGVDVHVSHLRRKLGPRPDGRERIRSVRGIGYLYALHRGD